MTIYRKIPKYIHIDQISRSVVSDSLRPHELHAAHQASLSITNSWSSLKFMSIQLVSPLSPMLMRNANRTSSRMQKSCINLHFNTEFISKLTGDTCGIRSAFQTGEVDLKDPEPCLVEWVILEKKTELEISCPTSDPTASHYLLYSFSNHALSLMITRMFSYSVLIQTQLRGIFYLKYPKMPFKFQRLKHNYLVS